MKRILLFLIFMGIHTFVYGEYINLGKFDKDSNIFKEKDVARLSAEFLDTKYVANTLSNEEINTSKENLVINFQALDCFTFIDTIRALRKSDNFNSFKQKLIDTRYKQSKIDYHYRNHFFSDWIKSNGLKDITCDLGACKSVTKYLNINHLYLKEIPVVKREIYYIPTKDIDFSKLKNGDYVGIFTDKRGLDVTHTGLIIKKDGKVYLRHASSLHKKVMDSELLSYTKNKLGVLVYRDK